MSFQGDVGGIGLADLLQSLARGRDGVLHLLGKDGTKSTLGVSAGMLHLLPEADEDPETWRNRARQSWVKDPDFRIDALRMEEVARACRLEAIYQHLDSEGVHFRFTPGVIPQQVKGSALSSDESGLERQGVRRDAVFIPPLGIESLLLEYARLKDELQSSGIQPGIDPDLVVIPVDTSATDREGQRFFAECDGLSNLRELADRFGTPLRQARLLLWRQLTQGTVRLAAPGELLLMAETELGNGYCERAAARLRAWWQVAEPGPLPELEARMFDSAWKAGRLQVALRSMPAAGARSFLRRLEAALAEPVSAPARWVELARRERGDRIAIVRMVHWQVRTSADPNVPAVKDLMAMSRAFLDEKRKLFARALLRIAAARAPDASGLRLDLGLCLIESGLPALASPFILGAARDFLDKREVEKAIPPLRLLCEAVPHDREARRLYARARAQGVGRTLAKRNSLIAIAIGAALVLGAVVQYRTHRSFTSRLDHVLERMGNPRDALQILDLEFPEDESGRITELRGQLSREIERLDNAARTAWLDRYKEAQLECTIGDALLGLRRTLALKDPPDLAKPPAAWPLSDDLFSALLSRLDGQFKLLGTHVLDTPAQVRSEEKFLAHISELESVLTDVEAPSEATASFRTRLLELETSVRARGDQRAEARQKLAAQQSIERQDQILASARAHDKANDFERSLAAYAELLALDQTKKLAGILGKEIAAVTTRRDAVRTARELAGKGEHDQAHVRLEKALERPTCDEIALSWRVTSFPTGARARLPDGSERVTPFSLSTSWNEPVDLRFELEGHETVTVPCEHPGDRSIYLSRIAERSWTPAGRVETMPIGVGDDHVVADRTGKIARLGRKGEVVWSQSVDSLGGFARSPVFLPRRAGHLLFVTEDGDVWIVDAVNGEMEGPWSSGAPPVAGPIVTDDGVHILFRGDKGFAWRSRLKPDPLEPGAIQEGSTSRNDGGLAVLRRRDESTKLASPWATVTVEVQEAAYLVRDVEGEKLRFCVRRTGDWSYVAWEAPTTKIPRGRLWIADGAGLRSFLP